MEVNIKNIYYTEPVVTPIILIILSIMSQNLS